jgi:LysR family glycine cleavage system transcriptional activator
LKTGGVYSLCPQPSAASHPAFAGVMQWFADQVEHAAD